ncbi:MAG: iron-containing alcohol dehydrogenase, partial [Candidatus Saelkia tenebricola]|nr:iron-containing alcohol dehydrogenase [Candidatus Saelkia tenebricola]
HPIGALFGLSHGLVNAVLLPVVSEFNYQFSESKFNHISKCILPVESRKRFHNLLKDFNKKLKVPLKFSQLGLVLDKKTEDKIVYDVKHSGVLKCNPRKVSEKEIRGILKKLW